MINKKSYTSKNDFEKGRDLVIDNEVIVFNAPYILYLGTCDGEQINKVQKNDGKWYFYHNKIQVDDDIKAKNLFRIYLQGKGCDSIVID